MPRGGHPPHQIQALDRTQPGLPMKQGRAGTMTHDYIRHGTTTLFAALNVLDGTRDRPVHAAPPAPGVHPLPQRDRGARCRPASWSTRSSTTTPAHKHPKVRAWLARHPRWTFHFTPTSCSWLNAVEAFFATLTRRRLQARRVPLAGRPPGRHQPLPRRAQPAPQALRLDRRSRPHHRQGHPRASSVGVRSTSTAVTELSGPEEHLARRGRSRCGSGPNAWQASSLSFASAGPARRRPHDAGSQDRI